MTPELLAMLTPEEREAWKTCREPRCGKGCDEYIGGFPQPTTCGLGRGHRGVCDPNDDREVSPSDLAAALTTIATLRAEHVAYRANADDLFQEMRVRGEALQRDLRDAESAASVEASEADRLRAELNGILDDARVLAAAVGIPADSDAPMTEALRRVEEFVAARDILRETLAEQQRAFVIGLDLAQRTADAEIAELRATLANDRGEGEPPSEGWKRNTTGDGMWERILAMRPSWTSEQEGEPTDTLIVGRDDDVHWRWERYADSGAGQRLVGGVGGIECARTAMKAADDAVKGAT